MTKLASGTAGGTHVADSPLTIGLTAKASPELLQNSIDNRIVRIRPMATPIDQLSRCAGSRHASSMTVEYYSVDTKKTEALLVETDGNDPVDRGSGLYTFNITVDDYTIFEKSETILFPTVIVGAGAKRGPLVGYIYDIAGDGTLVVAPINAPAAAGVPVIPEFEGDEPVVRMGRAATELDVQTPQFQALPRKSSNYCQIFKMQIEQSTLQKIAAKEVEWSFSDQEEAAVYDMRLGMEKNFLFGAPAKIYDASKGEDVYLTGGIWGQTTNSFEFDYNNVSGRLLNELSARAFTGNNGSRHKILIAGTDLVKALSNLAADKVVHATDTFVKWGIEFNEIRTNFGSLYVLHSEVFDQCNHSRDGFVLDPDYMTKYCHIPFSVETLDLRRSGQRNTDALVLTEASCLVLRYPDSHMRVIGK